ncbi:MAG: sugar O-acetyltransferase [Rikenellaceae bacterium]
MTEREKMLSGESYNANDELLVAERERCKELCYDYNHLRPSQCAERDELLRILLGRCGDTLTIEPSIWFDYGYNIEVGENFYSNHNLVILDGAKVSFGDNVFIAPNCGFYTASHPIDVSQRNRGIESALPITVGDNVWIGAGVTVLQGVAIGDNSVIGAGSVVVKSIPANSVAFGNPCRVIRGIDVNNERSLYTIEKPKYPITE